MPDKYSIKDSYHSRISNSFHDDTTLKDEYQDEVYAYAKLVFMRDRLSSVVDLGCGSAYKLNKYFRNEIKTGIDLEPTVKWLKHNYYQDYWRTWEQGPVECDLVICADMIEHVIDPDEVVEFIDHCHPKRIVISTPDRLLLSMGQDGPPNNMCHIREWTFQEFEEYLRGVGWKIHSHFISNKDQCTQLVEATCS